MSVEVRTPPGNTPPQDLAAETAVLGAIMVSADAMERVADVLKPESFYHPRNGHVFRAAVELFKATEPVDSITVRAQLEKHGVLEPAGGPEYLATLEAAAGIPSNIESHARRIEETAVRRGLLLAATRIQELGQNATLEVDAALDAAEKEIFRLAQDRTSDDAVPLSTSLGEYWDQIEKLHEDPDSAIGVKSGYYQLDEMTGGFQPASLVILAARPSVGKTSLALCMAQNVAVKEKVPVAVFSLEMSRYDLTSRLLCAEANVNSRLVRTGKLSETDWQKIANAMGTLSEGQIYIDDRPTLTALELRARARRLKIKYNIGMVVIDYIQLMYGNGRAENRNQEVSEISRALKALARELNIPVIALSQLNRASEQRGDHRPQLSDLRESGALEQDSDVVMFIYREGLHNDEVNRNKAELIVAKHRNGPIGEVPLLFLEDQTKFVNTTRQSPQGPQGPQG
ncbi:MAG: replicative DNA helicase [Candidatus Dormiibacterota bacterium]